jgi:hypothetical protein
MTLECRNTKLLTHLWVHHNVCHCPWRGGRTNNEKDLHWSSSMNQWMNQ